ncbi:hypothetical protein FB480_10633 [Agrobacterium vitis]|nr:hypothetical protein FB480_10633 [Agrobacterium vitis]
MQANNGRYAFQKPFVCGGCTCLNVTFHKNRILSQTLEPGTGSCKPLRADKNRLHGLCTARPWMTSAPVSSVITFRLP